MRAERIEKSGPIGQHITRVSQFDREARPEDKERLFRYLGRTIRSQDVNWELIRLAMMSGADTAIFPMQDILGLGHEAQMNKPSVVHGNWAWRFLPEQLIEAVTA